MSKPLGLSMNLDSAGLPRFSVTPICRVTDQIWDAVREAICANMTPEQFKREASEAWEYHLKEDAKHAREQLTR